VFEYGESIAAVHPYRRKTINEQVVIVTEDPSSSGKEITLQFIREGLIVWGSTRRVDRVVLYASVATASKRAAWRIFTPV